MTDDVTAKIDAFITPGALLKAAREAQEISERETADRLNWMPNYVGIIERDDYQSLRSPAFARGYVKAYGRLLQLDEDKLLAAFDRLRSERETPQLQRIETRSLQLQHTGLGVVVGLTVLLLLVGALWWWQGGGNVAAVDPAELNDGETTRAGEQ